MQNEANRAKQTQFPAVGQSPAADCAKRTQFPAGPGGARLEGRPTRGECAKRTQFGSRCPETGAPLADTRPRPGSIVQNKANSWRMAGAWGTWAVDRAKRSQFSRRTCKTNPIFPAVPGETGSGGRKSLRAIVQNEANLSRDGRAGAAGARDVGANVQNKPNSQGSSRSEGCGIRHYMPAGPNLSRSAFCLLPLVLSR